MPDFNAIKAGSAYVEITADDVRLAREMQTLETRMMTWGKRFAAAFGIGFSVGAITAFGKAAIEEAAGAEASQLDLASAMRQTNQYTEDGLTAWTDYSLALSMSTHATHEQIESMLSLGMTLGNLSGTSLKQATEAAMGWAKVMGIAPQDAMRMEMMAMRGIPRAQMMFQRYGVEFTGGAGEGALQAMLPGGQAGLQRVQAEMSGMAGDISRARKMWDEFKEGVGKGAWEAGNFGDVLDELTTKTENSALAMEGISGAIGLLSRIFLFVWSMLGQAIALIEKLLAGLNWALSALPDWLGGASAEAFARRMDKASEDTLAASTRRFNLAFGISETATGAKKPRPKGLPIEGEEFGLGGITGAIAGIGLAGAVPGQIAYPGGGAQQPVVERLDKINTTLERIDMRLAPDGDPYAIQ